MRAQISTFKAYDF